MQDRTIGFLLVCLLWWVLLVFVIDPAIRWLIERTTDIEISRRFGYRFEHFTVANDDRTWIGWVYGLFFMLMVAIPLLALGTLARGSPKL